MNERFKAIAGSVVFLFVAPGIVAGVIPWSISLYVQQPPLFGVEPVRWLGVLLLALGAVLLAETFARFALQGLGTPAPIAPTRTLVVTGSYRFVRNPMYVAVVSLIVGQALLLGSVGTLIWGAVVWLTALVSMMAVQMLFPQVYGGNVAAVTIQLAVLFAYLGLTVMAARERPP